MCAVHVEAGVAGNGVKAELAAAGSLLPAWGGARRGKRAAQDLGALAVCPSSMLSLSVLNISSTSCKRQHSPICRICSAGLCLLAIRNDDEQNVDRVIVCIVGVASGAGSIPAEQFAAAVKVLKNLVRQRFAAPFLEPVAEQAAPGYHSIIKHPRDLTSTLQGLESGSYPSLGVHSSPVAQLYS